MFRFISNDPGAVSAWLGTPAGRSLCAQEARLASRLLPHVSGYRCVQMGAWCFDETLLQQANTLRQWSIGAAKTPGIHARFDGLHLPLMSHSVDALVLAHSLEQVAEPHALLRECARVLSDRGQLIVFAFNPLSLWMWRQGLTLRRQARFTSCCLPPRAARLTDWLRLLEFETCALWRYGSGFPCFGRQWEIRSRALGAITWSAQAYALVARRRVALHRDLALKRRKPVRVPAGAARPATTPTGHAARSKPSDRVCSEH